MLACWSGCSIIWKLFEVALEHMTYTKRWTVIYTKHMKQRRKIFQDGVLEQSASGNKVMLYDDSEKLIDSMFLKKDEVVECGRTLTMEAHLVDVGDLEANHKPLPNLNAGGRDKKLDEVAETQRAKENRKSMLQSKRPCQVLDSIHCSIRDNKKNTLDSRLQQKHSIAVTSSIKVSKKTEFGVSGAPQTHPSTTHTPLKDGAVLSSKFLKSAECVESGNKFELPNYLVEVCEPRTFQEEVLHQGPLEQVTCSSCSSDSKFTTNMENLSDKTLPTEDLQKGYTEHLTGSSNTNIKKSTRCRRLLNDEPLRDACQILSILQKPLPKENLGQRKLPEDQALSSPSSDCSLLDVQSHTKKELTMLGMNLLRETVGDKLDYDSAGGAVQTSTSGSPFVNLEASQKVHTSGIIIAVDAVSEEKLPSDYYSSSCNQLSGQVAPESSANMVDMESTDKSCGGMTLSIAGSRVSDANACTSLRASSQGNASDNIRADNDRSLSGEYVKHSASNSSDFMLAAETKVSTRTSGDGFLSVYGVEYETVNQNRAESEKEGIYGRVHLLDTSEDLNTTSKNSRCECWTSLCLDVDEIPTFDLGF